MATPGRSEGGGRPLIERPVGRGAPTVRAGSMRRQEQRRRNCGEGSPRKRSRQRDTRRHTPRERRPEGRRTRGAGRRQSSRRRHRFCALRRMGMQMLCRRALSKIVRSGVLEESTYTSLGSRPRKATRPSDFIFLPRLRPSRRQFRLRRVPARAEEPQDEGPNRQPGCHGYAFLIAPA